jgi:hypothetical protein
VTHAEALGRDMGELRGMAICARECAMRRDISAVHLADGGGPRQTALSASKPPEMSICLPGNALRTTSFTSRYEIFGE